MANNIEIIIKSIDQSTAVLRNVEKNTKKLATETKKATIANRGLSNSFLTLKTAVVAYGTYLAGSFVKDLVNVGQQIEGLEVRLNALFGSTEEGAKAFQVMTDFAGRVPFSLEQIQQASGNLAVVSEDADELAKILEVTGNVASTTGLDFRTTAEQIQRAFAGGIASADIFREKGVRALLGFEAGATVSIEETRRRFFEMFGEGGEFGDMTDKLAQTFEGTMSMIGDHVFNFKRIINEEFFSSIKQQTNNLLFFLQSNQDKVRDFGEAIGKVLATAVNTFAMVVRFASDNATLLLTTFKLFIGLKLGKIFLNLATAIRVAGVAMLAFNKITKANIFFAIIGLIIAFIDKIIEAVQFIAKLANSLLGLDIQLETTEEHLKGMAEGAKKASKGTKELAEGGNAIAEAFGTGFNETIQTSLGSVENIVQQTGSAFADHLVNAVDSAGVAFADMVMAMDFSSSAFKNIFKDMAKEVIRQVGIMIARLIALKAMSVALGIPTTGGTSGFLANVPIIKDIPIIGGLFAKGGVVKGGLQGLPSYANGGITTQPQLALIGDNPNNKEAIVPLPDGKSIPVSLKGQGESVQNIGVINILPNANIDKALTDKPMSFWVDLTQQKILPALNNLGKSGSTTTLNFRGAR